MRGSAARGGRRGARLPLRPPQEGRRGSHHRTRAPRNSQVRTRGVQASTIRATSELFKGDNILNVNLFSMLFPISLGLNTCTFGKTTDTW